MRDGFDHYRLDQLVADPQLFLSSSLTCARGVGPEAQRKLLFVMGAVLNMQVTINKIPTNPLLNVPKPRREQERIARPFHPVVIERIRIRMRRRQTLDPSGVRAKADACFVSLMSYAGLRPEEALALTWRDIGDRTLRIEKAVSDGKIAPTKIRRSRNTPLLDPLRDDLEDLRFATGFPRQDTLIVPAPDGDVWSPSQYRNWRTRVWKPILEDLASGDDSLAPLAKARIYDCRGTFVSLTLRGGKSALDVAKWAGHSPSIMWNFYAGVVDELEGKDPVPAEEQIRLAREATDQIPRTTLDETLVDLIDHPTLTVRFSFGEGELEIEQRPSAETS